MEEVLFETEARRATSEIAATMRQVADRLEAGEPITFTAGTESVEVTPTDPATFEVKVEREGTDEYSVELEVEWQENGDGDLSVE